MVIGNLKKILNLPPGKIQICIEHSGCLRLQLDQAIAYLWEFEMIFDLDKAYDFSEQVIVITGGTGVLLRPTVVTLVSRGAQVVLIARTRRVDLMNDLAELGKPVLFIPVDVCEKVQIEKARDIILEKYGRVDVLINGAGGNRPEATTSDQQRFFDIPVDAVQGVLDLNFAGLMFACQVFGEVMARQGDGVILNISSMAGSKPLTRVVTYSAAKAAVNNLTQWLAVYLAREYSPRIRVNALAPGFLLTEQNRYLLRDEKGALTTRGEQILTATPMGGFGNREDMVGPILWLISDAARFVTGVVVSVDGGFSAFGGV